MLLKFDWNVTKLLNVVNKTVVKEKTKPHFTCDETRQQIFHSTSTEEILKRYSSPKKGHG